MSPFQIVISTSPGSCRDVTSFHVLFKCSWSVFRLHEHLARHISPQPWTPPPSRHRVIVISWPAPRLIKLSFRGRHLTHRYLYIYRHCMTLTWISTLFHTPIEFAVPRSRVTCLSRVEANTNVLETLKKTKLAPLDFLLDLLDQSYFSSYHAPFYNSKSFSDCSGSDRGSSVMKNWLHPHDVHLVSDQIHSEMECVKPYLRMSTKGCDSWLSF